MAILVFANGGFRLLWSKRSEVRRQRETLAVLQADHARLVKEWDLIQNDPTYTEYLIRKTLRYIKKDELEYFTR